LKELEEHVGGVRDGCGEHEGYEKRAKLSSRNTQKKRQAVGIQMSLQTDDSILRYGAMATVMRAGSQYAPLKRRATSTRLHGAISQRVVIFILTAVRT
jgi:hypothetical protein